MIVSTSPKENAPGGESPEALNQKPHVEMEITEMTHDTVQARKGQEKAVLTARTDAAFQQFMRKVLSVTRTSGQRFDRATVEGFRHA